MNYTTQHRFFCEKCGQEANTPDAISCDCGGEVGGICDARSRSYSLNAMSDAMAEVERMNVVVRRIRVAGKLAPEMFDAIDEGPNGIILWGAELEVADGVFTWGEEVVETPDDVTCV